MCARTALPAASTMNPDTASRSGPPRTRVRHYSRRTERAYVGWTRRYVLFHQKRHPSEMGAAGNPRLPQLPGHRTQGQRRHPEPGALCALVFLYRHVLEMEIGLMDGLVRAKRPVHLPVVLTPGEAAAVLRKMTGVTGLMGSLLYGSGLRLLECCRLRVKDIDFERREITVRDGKGRKDRVTVLPADARRTAAPAPGPWSRSSTRATCETVTGRSSCPTPSTGSCRGPRGSGPGNGSSRPPASTWQTGTTGQKRRHHLHEIGPPAGRPRSRPRLRSP